MSIETGPRSGSGEGRGRGRWLVIAGLVVVLVGFIGGWWALDRLRERAEGTELGSMITGFGERRAEWVVENQPELLEPASSDGEPMSFTVQQGEAIRSVADRLADQGIVKDADAFAALARVEEADTKVQAGDHVVSSEMTALEVLEALMIAEGDQTVVTIPEGLRIEEIAQRVADAGVADVERFVEIARDAGSGRAVAVVGDRPADSDLEGYLFPDTYNFEPDEGAESVIDKMLANFVARVPADIQDAAATRDLTPHEAVTLASIVERETPLPDERPRVARVFLNRLAEAPFILNADPTVQYALGFQPDQGDGGSWWKRPLLTDDLQVESPYNTYQRGGLPPGPIANPGLASLEAVLSPAEGDWQYFVADEVACDGSHVFAETFEEHRANIAQYQTGDCGR